MARGWLVLLAVLLAGCAGGGGGGGGSGGPGAGEEGSLPSSGDATDSPSSGNAVEGVLDVRDGMTLQWDFDADGREHEAWVATLNFASPADILWRLVQDEGGGYYVPALVALVPAEPPAGPCTPFQPVLEYWGMVEPPDGNLSRSATVPAGTYHMVVSTNFGNGGGELVVGEGGAEVEAPRSSPLASAVAAADHRASPATGSHTASLDGPAGNGTWWAWGAMEFSPGGILVPLASADGGRTLAIDANGDCGREEKSGPDPVTVGEESVMLRRSGGGPITLHGSYTPAAGAVAGGGGSLFHGVVLRAA